MKNHVKWKSSLALSALAALMVAACGGGGSSGNSGGSPAPATTACAWRTLALADLAYEERRLEMQLPFSGADVVGTDETPFATRILADTGFDVFAPAFRDVLCKDGKTALSDYDTAMTKVKEEGAALWRAAVDRVQGRRTSPEGSKMPNSDDRMLYWARVQMSKALREWNPVYTLSDAQRDTLWWEFERSSRGQYDIDFPTGNTPDGKKYRRMIVSGFDVFTLGTPPGLNGEAATIGRGIRNGNPSGATALEIDGREYTLSDGSILHVESYVLPVSYPPFHRGMQEDTLGPWFFTGPKQVDASISMSQGGANQFWLEIWNGRYHGPGAGNDGQKWCTDHNQGTLLPGHVMRVGSEPLDPYSGKITDLGSGCNTAPPARWLGYDSQTTWMKDFPPQFSKHSLPVATMLLGNSQSGVVRPVGADSQGTEGFDVTYHSNYTYFPDCNTYNSVVVRSSEVMNAMPDLDALAAKIAPVDENADSQISAMERQTGPQPPNQLWCAVSGGGGNYLSNESAYRNTVLRDVFHLDIPAGHIHIPVMNNYHTGTDIGAGETGKPRDDNAMSDDRYEAYRTAIVQQGVNLLKLIGESLITR